MTLYGDDVSAFQSVTPDLTGLSFLGVRATYGTGRDPMYDTHSTNAHAHGKVVMAYGFGIYGDGAAQARAFLSVAAAADLMALDLEVESGKTPMTYAQAGAFIRTVQAAGRTCGLYHSRSGYPVLGQDFNWVAEWGPVQPDITWAFWQDRGSPLDLDEFNGGAADLAALVAAAGGPGGGTVTECIVDRVPLVGGPRRFGIAAGATINGYDPAQPGKVVKSATFPSGSSADATHTVSVSWPGTNPAPVPRGGPFLLVSDGTFAGLLVVAASVSLAPDPPDPTPYSQAQVDALNAQIAAAKAQALTAANSGFNDGRSASIAAVTAIKTR